LSVDIAFRVIADHIRALSFAIADGIIPSNEGRGYVLRRVLRPAVRYGRALGFHEPFFFELVDVLAKTMGDVFPELRAKQKAIQETIRREEESFNKTLDKGIELFDEAVRMIESISHFSGPGEFKASEFSAATDTYKNGNPSGLAFGDAQGNLKKEISGDFAFRLYDEQGFPLDLTELMARERGLTVDVAEFEKLMDQQRERARRAQKKETIAVEQGEVRAYTTKLHSYAYLQAEDVMG